MSPPPGMPLCSWKPSTAIVDNRVILVIVFTSLLRGPRASPRYLAPRITPACLRQRPLKNTGVAGQNRYWKVRRRTPYPTVAEPPHRATGADLPTSSAQSADRLEKSRGEQMEKIFLTSENLLCIFTESVHRNSILRRWSHVHRRYSSKLECGETFPPLGPSCRHGGEPDSCHAVHNHDSDAGVVATRGDPWWIPIGSGADPGSGWSAVVLAGPAHGQTDRLETRARVSHRCTGGSRPRSDPDGEEPWGIE